jgi:protein-tyrosine phosphatase
VDSVVFQLVTLLSPLAYFYGARGWNSLSSSKMFVCLWLPTFSTLISWTLSSFEHSWLVFRASLAAVLLPYVFFSALLGGAWLFDVAPIASIVARIGVSNSDGGSELTSENDPMRVDWILDDALRSHSVSGRLGMSVAPGRKKPGWRRSLVADLRRLKEAHNVDVVVNLLRPKDMDAVAQGADSGASMFDAMREAGLSALHSPIRDKFIPESFDEFCALVDAIVALLRDGKSVSIHCLADDMQVLTERGFMFRAELLEQLAASGGRLRVASYNARSRQLVYESPIGVVDSAAAPHRIVEFSSACHGVSARVTDKHDMFVARDGAHFRKVRAEQLLSLGATFLAHAENGVAGEAQRAPDDAWLMSPPVLKLYGAWLLSSDNDVDSEKKRTDSFVLPLSARATLLAFGLQEHIDFCSSCDGDDGTLAVFNSRWVRAFYRGSGSWLWTLGRDAAHSVLAGMMAEQQHPMTVRTGSSTARDIAARLALHAGFSAHWLRSDVDGQWLVQIDADAQPIDIRPTDVREAMYCGRVWCLEMPHGLLVTRRARANAKRIVTEASRPVVVGNCNGGKGRTGLVVACVLMRAGAAPTMSAARQVILSSRTGCLKNPVQQLYATAYAHFASQKK